MAWKLQGKVALITGAGSGIGRSIAQTLAAAGASIVVNDIDPKSAHETATEMKSDGYEALALPASVVDETQVMELIANAQRHFGKLDILVNNAGGGQRLMVEDMQLAEWQRIIDVNLTGVFLCSRAVLAHMKARHSGRIINVASTAAKRISFHAGAHYTAAKYGVLGFTRHLAFELAPYQVTVNAICPAATLTPLLSSHTTPEQRRERAELIPMGRLAMPEDHAQAVLFLASEAAGFITGQALDVDGGSLLAWRDYASYEKAMKQSARDEREEP